jgi:hypothetical protein
MMLRLWIEWDPVAGDIFSYHLEVERPYARVPAVGETIDLPRTRFGLAHAEIEQINWDYELPNLILESWEEAEGAKYERLIETGFHLTTDSRPGCMRCARAANDATDTGKHRDEPEL